MSVEWRERKHYGTGVVLSESLNPGRRVEWGTSGSGDDDPVASLLA